MKTLPLISAALLWTAPLASQEQSHFKPVKVGSCALADSLLGPIGDDRRAIVRALYLEAVDSTVLVAGPEFGGMVLPEQHGSDLSVVTSYGGHKPTTPPHAHVSSLMIRSDATSFSGSAVSAPVVLTLDETTFQLDSVPLERSLSPVGPAVFIQFELAPNFFFGLAGAKHARFQIGKVRRELKARQLQDIRGTYRVALCGLGDTR